MGQRTQNQRPFQEALLGTIANETSDDLVTLREITPRVLDLMANVDSAREMIEALSRSKNLKRSSIAIALDVIAKRAMSGEINLRISNQVLDEFFSNRASDQVYFSASVLGALVGHPDAIQYLERLCAMRMRYLCDESGRLTRS